MEKLIKVAFNDFRLVFRDPSLSFFFVFPLLNVLVIRYGVPFVVASFEFLADYTSIILMSISMQGALIFGFIYSMVLIDENDTQVAKIYGVLPVSKFWFVIARLIAPFLFSSMATFLIFLGDPFFGLSIPNNLIFSVLCGLNAPIMVLFVTTMAKNKIEGMTWQKLFNIPVSIPLLAFFAPVSVSYIFAVFPTYWVYQGLSRLFAGENPAGFILIATLYSLSLIALLAARFSRTHFA